MAQNRHVLLPLVFASITALAFDAATIRPTFDPASIQGRVRLETKAKKLARVTRRDSSARETLAATFGFWMAAARRSTPA